MKVLQSRLQLENSPKGHTVGLEKAVPPAETIRRLNEVLDRTGLQLVHDVIRIDRGRFDIPVYVCQMGEDCNMPTRKTMGKGPTPEQSEASALMEMVERFSHANFPRPGTYVRGTFLEMEEKTIPFEHFFRIPGLHATASEREKEGFCSLPFSWVPAYSLVQKRDFLIPYEWFADIQGTNGLSAGNTFAETVLQGLCEVVERHVCSVVNSNRKTMPTIDLYSVQDPVARDLISKFARNHIRILCKDFSLDTGIPTVGGVAFDPTTFPNSEIVYCAGTATHPEKALIRLLTEIQQMAVDDFRQDYYEGGILPKFRNWQEAQYLFNKEDPIPIQSLPDVSSNDMLEEIERCTAVLHRIGFDPLVINITHPVLGIPAVFVFMAGSELYESTMHELNPTYYIGRKLEFIGRFEEAIEHFRLSMEEHPASKLHCTLETANCLKYLHRWDEAIEKYKEAYRYGPDRAVQLQMILHSLKFCSDKQEEAAKMSAI